MRRKTTKRKPDTPSSFRTQALYCLTELRASGRFGDEVIGLRVSLSCEIPSSTYGAHLRVKKREMIKCHLKCT